jgi:hypothetical protein
LSARDGLATKAADIVKGSFHYIALGLLTTYCLIAYANRELGVSRFEKPFLGSTLLILLVAALVHASDLSRSKRNIDHIANEMGLLRKDVSALAGTEDLKVSFYEGKKEFYSATISAVRAARRRVWVTHLRNAAPLLGEFADEHFRACREWATGSNDDGGERSFRRIILHGDNEDLRDFCRKELKFSARANAKEPRYLVKILTGPVHLTEAFNVGIYDDMVFFSHRHEEQVIGFCVQNKNFAQSYIRQYYERLWDSQNAEPIRADLIA